MKRSMVAYMERKHSKVERHFVLDYYNPAEKSWIKNDFFQMSQSRGRTTLSPKNAQLKLEVNMRAKDTEWQLHCRSESDQQSFSSWMMGTASTCFVLWLMAV